MRELGPDRLSEDGRFLIARDPATGELFSLRADHRLASLIDASGLRTRPGRTPGQLEITMESSLSPRDIQSRIRRGETPDSVAESAGVPVEQIMGFATPVLAEREYMCDQARKTSIRRKHVGGAGVLLGLAIDESIAGTGGVPEAATWDSWRREDGRWTVIVTPEGADLPATFLFDVKGRYVLPADETAHELVGDIALPDTSDMAIADAISTAPAAREAEPENAVLPEAEPETVLTAEQIAAEDLGLHAPVRSLKEVRDRKALEQLALTEVDDTDDEQPEAESTPPQHDDFEQTLERDIAVNDEPPARKKHERRRVPSWDEIMFGGKDG